MAVINATDKYITLKLDQIDLLPENPRTNKKTTQEEIFDFFVADNGSKKYGRKILTLAQDIIDNGLNENDLPIVVLIEGRYIVYEGNRRVIALKALCKPSNIKNEYFRNKYIELRNNFKYRDEEIEIKCYLDTLEHAEYLMSLKHDGEQDGIGTVSWDPRERLNFKNRHNKIPDLKVVIENYIKQHNLGPKDKQIHFSIFERILPDIKKRFNLIVNEDGELQYDGNKQTLQKNLKRILLLLQDETTRTLNDRDGKDIFWEKFDNKKPEESATESEGRDTSTSEDSSSSGGEGETNSSSGDGNDSGSTESETSSQETSEDTTSEEEVEIDFEEEIKRDFKSRTTLVPKSFLNIIPSEYTKIRGLLEELKRIKVEKNPVCCAMGFRGFIEYSAKTYTAKFKHKDLQTNEDSNISGNIRSIAGDLIQKNKITKSVVSYMNRRYNDKYCPLNDIVHGPNYAVNSTQLCMDWDAYSLFLKSLWEEVSNG